MKRGPFLRITEDEQKATLCNNDGMLEDPGEGDFAREFEVVSPRRNGTLATLEADPGTSRSPETQVVYVREDVSVWPARKRRITGRLRLIKQNAVIFFAWLPYNKEACLDATGSHSSRDTDDSQAHVPQGQYAVHPIPLSDLKAIRKQTPKLGSHHIVLILKNGLTLLPLFFGNGGVRALLAVLKQNAVLTKSEDSPCTYLVNDTDDPLQRSLATLDLSDALMLDPAQLQALSHRKGGQDGSEDAGHMALIERMKDGMQRASQFARNATSSLLLPSTQPLVGQNGRECACPPVGFPKQISLSGTSAPGCASRQLSPQPAFEGSHMFPGRQQQKGDGRAETSVGLFEVLDHSESESMQSTSSQPCPPPLTRDEWFTFLDASGRIIDSKALRMRIFDGGVEPSIRKEAWKHLLGIFPESSTAASRKLASQERLAEYERIKAQWTSISPRQAARFGKWRERQLRVDKDVRRTDCSHPFFAGEDNHNVAALRRILLTYSMYNFDLGYCQGMSDLASPILFVMEDEALAFWCFVSLMERMEANFHTDCTGMHAQLAALSSLVKLIDPELHAFLEAKDCSNFFFSYRWLLVHFKREFSFDEALQLWEALWSCPFTKHFHVYMCAAVLRSHREEIMGGNMSFDDLLGFCIQLSGRLDLGRTLRSAEQIFKAAGQAGVQCVSAPDLP